MKITEFANLLETIGVPVAMNRFSESQQPPFLIYVDVGTTNFGADDIVYYEAINIDVELYSWTVDDELENRIKKLFTDNGIYYEWTRNWIETEKIYQTIYEVNL
jgi:hypothetical protein